MRRGSVLFFNGYLLHRSKRNASDRYRRSLVNHYMSTQSPLHWCLDEELEGGGKHSSDNRSVHVVCGEDPYAYLGYTTPANAVYLREYDESRRRIPTTDMRLRRGGMSVLLRRLRRSDEATTGRIVVEVWHTFTVNSTDEAIFLDVGRGLRGGASDIDVEPVRIPYLQNLAQFINSSQGGEAPDLIRVSDTEVGKIGHISVEGLPLLEDLRAAPDADATNELRTARARMRCATAIRCLRCRSARAASRCSTTRAVRRGGRRVPERRLDHR